MSSEDSSARSNYFAVKDRKQFSDWCAELDYEIIEEDGLVGFMASDGLTSWLSLPKSSKPVIVGRTILNTPSDDDEVEYEVVTHLELAQMLATGHVAIVTGIYHDKMRYLGGFSFAVNSEGALHQIDLGDIDALAKTLGDHVTDCSY